MNEGNIDAVNILRLFDEFVGKVQTQSATCMRQEREIVILKDEITRLHAQIDEITENTRSNANYFDNILVKLRDNSSELRKELQLIVNNFDAETRLIQMTKEVI